MKTLIFILICLCLFIFSYDQSRKFICIGGDNWVTIWKRYGNNCLIIPGRYYGIAAPSTSFLRTENTATISLLSLSTWSDTIVFRTKSHVEIKNELSGRYLLNFYSEETRLRALLYTEQEPRKVKDSVKVVFVDIHDSVALNGDGERLW